MRRLLLALATLVLTLLVAEGALSLLAGRSLREVTTGHAPSAPALPPPDPATDAERHAIASGKYVVDDDPLVRFTVRPDAKVSFADVDATTGPEGLRVRPGPPPPDGSQRLVVLGDSVAFGLGLTDDRTLAADLERLLAQSRGPAARPLACYTVAAPGWNHRNEVQYLVDHWDELRPDIVVYVPISNDLSDAADLYDNGAQRLSPDPAQPDPWLMVSNSQLLNVEGRLGTAWKQAEMGPEALEADLSPESARRYDDNAASIVRLDDLLAAHGAHLLVIQSELYRYPWHLYARVRRLRPDLPILFLERFVPESFHLPGDPHPNAATVQSRAIVVAQRLVELGFVDAGAAAPFPELPAAFREVLAHPSDLQNVEAIAARDRDGDAAALKTAIDLRTGEGFHQIYGGLNLDGSLRMHLLALLAAKGDAVRITVAPLSGRPDLYPLKIDVDVDGAPVGSLQLQATELGTATLPLPAALARSGRPFELRLRPAGWCVVQDRGRSEVASGFLVRLDAAVDG